MDTNILLSSGFISFATALATTSGVEFIKPVTQVFDNWFYTKFGSKADFERKKKELKNEHELNLYKSELKKEIPDIYRLELEKERLLGLFKKEITEGLLEIPPKNIQVPDQQIVALIMENIHLYLSIDDLRSKFAKLLASSADKSQSEYLHPLYVETIKTLSVTDARFLESLGDINFTIIDDISLKSVPDEDGSSHGFHIEDEEELICTTFTLKLDKKAPGLPITFKENVVEDLLDRGLYIENEKISPVYFLEKQNILTRKKIQESKILYKEFFKNYMKLMAYLVEENQNVIDFKKEIERRFKQTIIVEHEFYIVELSKYGRQFKHIILD